MKFIVLGSTAKLGTSKRLLGRYKESHELHDIFYCDRLRKPARRGLIAFRVLDSPTEDSWYLVSFDIKGRKASKEYTYIKKWMFLNLCGRIDNSTYICPIPADRVPLRYTSHVEMYPVTPHDERTRRALEGSVKNTIQWIISQIRTLNTRGRWYVKAENLLKVRELLSNEETRRKIEETAGKKLLQELESCLNSLKQTLESWRQRRQR